MACYVDELAYAFDRRRIGLARPLFEFPVLERAFIRELEIDVADDCLVHVEDHGDRKVVCVCLPLDHAP